MKTFRCVLLACAVLLLTSCNTNPLVGPMDTMLNETIVPDYERLMTEMVRLRSMPDEAMPPGLSVVVGQYDDDFVGAKMLEIQAMRELVEEAKGDAK